MLAFPARSVPWNREPLRRSFRLLSREDYRDVRLWIAGRREDRSATRGPRCRTSSCRSAGEHLKHHEPPSACFSVTHVPRKRPDFSRVKSRRPDQGGRRHSAMEMLRFDQTLPRRRAAPILTREGVKANIIATPNPARYGGWRKVRIFNAARPRLRMTATSEHQRSR